MNPIPETVSYSQYLHLDQLLDCQHPRSATDGPAAHDEMLFIVVHQAYELWFKQILHELDSVLALFGTGTVPEREVGTAVHRLRRVIAIQGLLVEQIRVLETMTPLDFLDFRHLLSTASGFQSWQFRLLENKLGLPESRRLRFGGRPYTSYYPDGIRARLEESEQAPSLFDGLSAWLERTPFLDLGEFHFLEEYGRAVERMLEKDRQTVRASTLITEEERAIRLRMIDGTAGSYRDLIDPARHAAQVAAGERRLNHRATVAALFINLYRDEPILQMPFNLLQCLVEIDENLAHWRSRHTQMVLRMLGRKIGTGGSTGFDYLRETVDRHRIFTDLFDLATCLIPRGELPALPPAVTGALNFHFGEDRSPSC
jgi:tryptophan 2,3-dioxygenase